MGDVPSSKPKSAKPVHPESRTTLDALHIQKVSEMADEKRNIQQFKAQIEALTERQKQVILAKQRGIEHIGNQSKFLTKQKRRRLERN